MEKPSDEKNPGIKIYGNSSLLERVNAFQQNAEQHKSKQLSNPFSNHEGSGSKKQMDINDPKYVNFITLILIKQAFRQYSLYSISVL